MQTTIDIEAYLSKIHYSGPRLPVLEVLKELHLLHTLRIPFENIDPFLHEPVLIDESHINEKLVQNERGGYCFEQNLLFFHVLTKLGFDVTPIMGRVILNQPLETITARSHMLLLISLKSEAYLADVGFGSMTLTSPLRFTPNEEQETPHEKFRIIPEHHSFRLEGLSGGKWKHTYRFTLEKAEFIDFQVSNHYVSTYPASHFRHQLIAARPCKEGRLTLNNNVLSTYLRDGSTTKKTLNSADEVLEVLETRFGIKGINPKKFSKRLSELSLFDTN